MYDAEGRMSDIQYNEAAGTAPTADVHIVDETLEQSPFGRLVLGAGGIGGRAGYHCAYEYVPFNPHK